MIRWVGVAFAVLMLFVLAATLHAQESPMEILILENARVGTGDSAVPEARGLVIADGRISRLLQDEGTLGFPQDGPVRRIDLADAASSPASTTPTRISSMAGSRSFRRIS